MVNPNSSAFQFSEKIGLFIGKVMRYITQLWKDTKDIEFVRQTIGHRSLNATSAYVAQMGDEERQNRISRI